MTAGARKQDGWLRRLIGYCLKHRRLVALALGGSIAATAAQVTLPLIMGWIVDDAVIARREPIWLGACLLIAVGLASYAGVYTRRYRAGQLSLGVQHDLRIELFESLQHLDGARQDELHTGQIVSRAISDLNMVQSLLQQIPVLLGNALLFVASISVMLWLSPLLTVVALAIAPALWLIAIASRRKLFPASWDGQQKEAEVAGVVDGAVTGVRVVKGFGQEEQEVDRLDRAATRLYSARVRVVRLTARYTPALGAVPQFGQVGVLLLGGWLALRGAIPLGVFLAFSLYIGQMVSPVRALTSLITIGQEARASVIRVYEVIDARPVITEKPGAVALPAGAAGVQLDDVRFGYLPSQPVLRGLSLSVRPGETVAVVGSSGSGKSTISLLLPRFYDVRGGAVLVGGHDVRDLTLDSLRASIGLVMEDSFLFSDTIRANISYGRPDATMAQVVAAARAAEAEEFINSLPNGYATVIGEQGLTLSGGQRQRISLARALITNPSVLILDDATSAIDAAVEAQIHATLRKVMAGRTTLLIAHRRSTLQLADRIAVLDHGRLVDEGTHEELTGRCPLYRLLLAGPGEDAEGVDAGFRYPGQPADALAGVSLDVRPGETVALVGQTGAGKSTIVKLIARFYDVTSGAVLVDGVDVRDLDLSAYRQQLGVVPQEPYLFPGTIRDAIAYGRPDASDAEVEAAARDVGAVDMIARLPGGFRHQVAERGRNLAAGQRQLIALARAYLVDPAILLLDEATAALDLASEAAVHRATERLAARRTTIVVAHRLTTAMRADRIVVMDAGRVAEVGTHDELLARGGSYAVLWAAFAGDAEMAA